MQAQAVVPEVPAADCEYESTVSIVRFHGFRNLRALQPAYGHRYLVYSASLTEWTILRLCEDNLNAVVT